MRVQNGDVSLNVLVDGDDGAPPLLLLHGVLSCADTWAWVVPQVVDRFRVLRLDFRGHGDSDRVPGEYLQESYLADAVAACEQVAGEPAVVIGHSLGAGIAAALAQTRPDLVRGVVLEDAGFRPPPERSVPDASTQRNETFRALRESIPQLQAAGLTVEEVAAVIAASPSAAGGTMGDRLHGDALLALAKGFTRVDASVLDVVLSGEMVRVHNPSQPIDRPVVAIAADPALDAATRPDDLARLQAVCPNVSTHTLSGASHLIHDTDGQREPFWAIVDEFLAAVL